jgi:hypothetical protein
MHLAAGTLILALSILFFVVVAALRARRGRAINQHPYRDPYGDAPGAWRQGALHGDPRASIQFARGTR